MSLLTEDYIDDFRLETVGDRNPKMGVYWDANIYNGLRDTDFRRLAELIKYHLHHCTVVRWPEGFILSLQDILMNVGWWILYDSDKYLIPIARKYFSICYAFNKTVIGDNITEYIIKWGEEPIITLAIQNDKLPDLNGEVKIESKYYVGT